MDIEISIEAKKKYIERRLDNLNALEKALDAKDPAVLKTIGHQLKGNARLFGYLDLEPIVIELERAGEVQDWIQAEKWVAEFRSWMENHKVLLS